MNPLQLLHTVRWLKPRQAVGQLSYQLQRIAPFLAPKPRTPQGDPPSVRWTPDYTRFGVGMRRHDQQTLRSGVLRFLNEEVTIGFPPDWDVDTPSKLWSYNLHYHDFLWSLPPADAQRVVDDWIDAYPFQFGRVGWDPYPTSLRLQNWCTFFLGRHRRLTEADGSFKDKLLRSIQIQADLLQRSLEIRLMGNHLLENAAALAMVGVCLDGSTASRQMTLGLELLREQLPEQLLSDGCHFERSPMYHARVTYLLEQLAACRDADLSRLVDPLLPSARSALALMSHPDGEIALLNDAVFEIAPLAEDLGIRAPGTCRFSLAETGYFGGRNDGGDFVICDAGPIGPDYVPGHAHGDIFSFELSLAGSRVVVDSGVFGYEADPMRAYCRSTQAHNTVEVEGVDQCEFWGAFRVARRAHVADVSFEETSDGFRLRGSHDGYRRIRGRPTHTRMFRWYDAGVLVVEDRLGSDVAVLWASRLHLHPACEIVDLSERRARILFPGGQCLVVFEGDGELGVSDSWYCPEFGIRIRNDALSYRSTTATPSRFCIAPDDERVTFDL